MHKKIESVSSGNFEHEQPEKHILDHVEVINIITREAQDRRHRGASQTGWGIKEGSLRETKCKPRPTVRLHQMGPGGGVITGFWVTA